jgi:hypothetical protein
LRPLVKPFVSANASDRCGETGLHLRSGGDRGIEEQQSARWVRSMAFNSVLMTPFAGVKLL